MKPVRAVLITAALTAIGCVAEEEEPSARVESVNQEPTRTVTDQTEFDLTFLFDREQFIEQDLHYLDSVGPYAIYEVTGEAPRLVGPEVYYPTELGMTAMLCAAHGFFTEPGTLVSAKLSLIDGFTGESFVNATVRSAEFESCTSPSDDYGERIPTEPDDPDTPTEDMVPRSGQLVVDVEGLLPIGSFVLLRRVAFGIAPDGHNGSHVIPQICCNLDFCGLGADAPLDEPIK
ncbi:MAG TPA: hypothetical protein VFB62_09380 [Polyangiaceae bacterium]|nr:hypothetical protein [Polyangiaceae bacterium]